MVILSFSAISAFFKFVSLLQRKKGEADRHIGAKKPKHLFSGKRGIGKTDRR